MRKKLRDDISLREITTLYRKERDGRIKEKLLTIKLIYENKKISDIAAQLGVCQKTIYNWLDSWNQEGVDGLKPRHEQAGRKGYLSSQEWEDIFAEVKAKELTVQEIQDYVKRTRGKVYNYKTIWKILNRRSNE